MKKKELRHEYERLINLKEIKDCEALLEVFLNYFWKVINNHHNDKVYSFANKDAKIINQMMFTKLLSLKKMLGGIEYEAENGSKLNNIIDPTVIASITRNIFETAALFNLIYRNTKSDEEKGIIYGLWYISGLKYRQRFETNIITKENKKKFLNEKKQIENVENEIKTTNLYKSLDDKNRSKIDNRIKEKEFKIEFKDKEVKYLNWIDIFRIMKLNEDLFNNIYSYLSLYSHPSNVSVFQFEYMFEKPDETYKQYTIFNVQYSLYIMSVFVSDYIYLFPEVKKTFENLNIVNQIALNAHNKILRGDEFSINEAWKNLE